MLEPGARVWAVGALCQAVADALDARFNPVSVAGEITGFARAASGHCYFALKDEAGQLRCAMFRRAASLLTHTPRDGERVEVRGRLDVYGPRGELQLIVESLQRAGPGALFEQFLRLKQKLEAEGLFDAARKRALPPMPRRVGLVTSLAAAALQDVLTALQRRVPHIEVVLSPASVQGANAPGEISAALSKLYQLSQYGRGLGVDLILLVRGGGALEDLWAFNDEGVVRTVAASPVPVVCGVGHETDFTLTDFAADLRAPTPTAAAELAAQPRLAWLAGLDALHQRLQRVTQHALDRRSQGLDQAAGRLGRPSELLARQSLRLASAAQRLRHAVGRTRDLQAQSLRLWASRLPQQVQHDRALRHRALEYQAVRLQLLDPSLVLQRGYAWLAQPGGAAVSRVGQLQAGQAVTAVLADGEVDLTVQAVRPD